VVLVRLSLLTARQERFELLAVFQEAKIERGQKPRSVYQATAKHPFPKAALNDW